MSNDRNVDALFALLEQWLGVGAAAELTEPTRLNLCRETAQFLASLGVLVPSALTDEECQAAWEVVDTRGDATNDPCIEFQDAGAMRTSLELIAKGLP